MTISIGADPEFFVGDEQGAIVPVCGLLGGTKKKPINFDVKGGGYAYHEDNVVAEISIPVTNDASAFSDAMNRGINLLEKVLFKKKLQIVGGQDEHRFTLEQLSVEKANEFGCDPDFEAYTGGEMRGTPPDFGRYRFAGGHIHLGGEFHCPPFVVAMLCDAVIGLNYSHFSNKSKRRDWYGQPGIYREKPYGIEYRSLGSNWVVHQSQVYDIGQRILNLCYWLESTSAPNIKTVVNNLNWIDIRNELVATTKNGARKKAIRLELRNVGLPG